MTARPDPAVIAEAILRADVVSVRPRRQTVERRLISIRGRRSRWVVVVTLSRRGKL